MKLHQILGTALIMGFTAHAHAQTIWAQVVSPTTQALSSVAWNNGLFVAVGDNGTIITSPDGVIWTPRLSGTTRSLKGVSGYDGIYFAVGTDVTLLTSQNGVDWISSRQQPTFTNPTNFNAVLATNQGVHAVGENGTYAYRIQPIDLFQSHGRPGNPTRYGLADAGGYLIGVGQTGIEVGTYQTSLTLLDGGIASRHSPLTVTNLYGVASAQDKIVAVGMQGSIVTSNDIKTWSPRQSGTTADLYGIAFFNNRWVSVGSGGAIVTSDDALSWLTISPPTNATLRALAASPTALVAVGTSGVILRSVADQRAPSIHENPISRTIQEGGHVVFKVAASGTSPLSYQWFRNGEPIIGENHSHLTLSNVAQTSGQAITARVSNSSGTATSAPAQLVALPASLRIVDESFRADPEFTAAPTSLLPLNDGRILVAGGLPGQVVRLLASGQRDPAFVPVAVDNVLRMEQDSLGRIYLGGEFTSVNGQSRRYVSRLLANGDLDPSFVPPSINEFGSIKDFLILPDGRIVLADGTERMTRLKSTGALDESFLRTPFTTTMGATTTINIPISMLAKDSQGSIYAAGGYIFSLVWSGALGRFNADGSRDGSFPTQQSDYTPSALRVLNDGTVALASYISRSSLASIVRRRLQRFSPNGTVELSSDLPSMLPALQVPVTTDRRWHDVYFYGDGRSLVSSNFTSVDGYPRRGFARLTRDATVDLTFDPGVTPQEPVLHIAVTADEKIYIAGEFEQYNGVNRPRLARLNAVTGEGFAMPEAVSLFPAETTIKAGESFVLEAGAVSEGPAVYRWYRGSRPEPDYPSPSPAILVKTTTQPLLELDVPVGGNSSPDGSVYYYTVSNSSGTALGPAVMVSVLQADPKILSQPYRISAQTGRDVVIIGKYNDKLGLSSTEWRRNGELIATQSNNATLRINSITAQEAGTFTFTVRNLRGVGVTSDPIVVTVDDTARFVNMSTRGWVGTGEQVMAAGFVLSGDSPREILVRGIGPGLIPFGVSDALSDPQLTVFGSNGVKVVSNDNWATSVSAGDMAKVGAFPLPPGSKDAAARLTSLAPGAYTVVLSAANGVPSGAGLVEVYESDNLSDRIVNLSTRSIINAQVRTAISGIIVRGAVSKTLLIRAVGPSLGTFGVAGPLADPTVSLVNEAGTIVATNDNWSDTAEVNALRAAMTIAGAFPLPDGSKDAAMLVTVPPGNYSALVRATNDSTGVVLVEVYEVP